MGSFCTYCGKPLPESGICECRVQAPQPQKPVYPPQAPQQPVYPQQQVQYQAPQPVYPPQQPQYQPAPQQYLQQPYAPQYQQPYASYPQQPYVPQEPAKPAEPSAFSVAIKQLFPFIKDFLKEPAAAIKKAVEEKRFLLGIIIAVLLAGVSMFAWMTSSFGLSLNTRGTIDRFTPTILPLTFGLFVPVALVALAALSIFLGSKISKKNVSFFDALTAAGTAGILPAAIMAVAVLLNLWFYTGLLLLTIFVCAAILIYVIVLREVFEAKSCWSLLVHLGFTAVGVLVGMIFYIMSVGSWIFNLL